MTTRELKALLRSGTVLLEQGKLRSGRVRMESRDAQNLGENLRAQLEALQRLLNQKDRQIEQLESRTEGLQEAKETASNQASTLEQQLEETKLCGELEMLRALEGLRTEHRRALEKEEERRAQEAARMDAWIQDLKDSHQAKEAHLLEKIAQLEKQVKEGSTTKEGRTSPMSGVTAIEGTGGEGEAMIEDADGTLSRDHTGIEEPSSRLEERLTSPVSAAGSSVVPTTTVALVPSGSGTVSTPSTSGGSTLSPTAPVFTPTSDSLGECVPTSIASAPTGATSLETSMLQTMTNLLQAQKEAMAAQAKAVALNNLPSLPCFTGEGKDVTSENGFERWIEKFRERAQFAGWTPEEQLYQLKSHLETTALEVFRMLPDSDKKDISSAIEALKKRFKPTDIEELRGLEFHHLSQGDSSIEQLGIRIQQLGHKAFPSITGKEFDRLLKGRFYQALLVKWQRKLESPKPSESFHDLVAHARMIEEYEKQYAALAAVQVVTGRMNIKVVRRGFPGSQQPKSDLPRPKGEMDKPNGKAEPPTKDKPRCYNCKEVGHKRRDCPQRPEAPGRGVSSNTGMVGADIRPASKPSVDPSAFTEEQLEHLLAQKRCKQEERNSLLVPLVMSLQYLKKRQGL